MIELTDEETIYYNTIKELNSETSRYGHWVTFGEIIKRLKSKGIKISLLQNKEDKILDKLCSIGIIEFNLVDVYVFGMKFGFSGFEDAYRDYKYRLVELNKLDEELLAKGRVSEKIS
jgi:hypothetical protein